MNTKDTEEIVEGFVHRFAVWNNRYQWAENDGVQSKCTPDDVAKYLRETLTTTKTDKQ